MRSAQCPECKGEGVVYDRDENDKVVREKCPRCGGDGYIIIYTPENNPPED